MSFDRLYTSTDSPLISIIIPVKNGKATIQRCLDAIFTQTLINQAEVIIIDSGSTDGTLDIVKNYPISLYQIPPEEFNHGATRNFGVSLAKGAFVVMTVQDAVANDSYWLQNMLRHFDDNNVAAVCGGQMVPHSPKNNPHEWFRPQSPSSIKKASYTAEEYNKLDKFPVLGLDDVNAMYRTSLLKQYPFKKVEYGEDMLWQDAMHKIGYSVVFDMNARIQHYHYQSFDYCYRNTIVNIYHIYKFFNTIKPVHYSLKEYLLVIYRNFKYKAHIKWILHQWITFFARTLAYRHVTKAIKNNSLDLLYQTKINKIPQGKSNAK